MQVLALFSELQELGFADIIHYDAAIGACGKAGDWQQALKYLQEAQVNRLQPDKIAYFTTLRACGNSEKWQEALQLPKLT